MDPAIWEILKWAAVLYLGAVGWFINQMWKRQTTLFENQEKASKELSQALTESSKEHNEKLIQAVNQLGEKISNNTRELWVHLRDVESNHVRQEHLEMQLKPIRDNIGDLRKDSERRHNERAAEHKELMQILGKREG